MLNADGGSRMVYTNLDKDTNERRFYGLSTFDTPFAKGPTRSIKKWVKLEHPVIPDEDRSIGVIVDESVQVVNQLSKVMGDVGKAIGDLQMLLRRIVKRLKEE